MNQYISIRAWGTIQLRNHFSSSVPVQSPQKTLLGEKGQGGSRHDGDAAKRPPEI